MATGLSQEINPQTEKTVDFIRRVRERIATVVVGQDVVVERTLIALFTLSLIHISEPTRPY